MKLRERLAHVLRWPGWRWSTPAAGSLVTHVVLGAAIFSVLAATSRSAPRQIVQLPPQLDVMLVSETPAPPKGVRPTAPDPPKAPPRVDTAPDAGTAPPAAKAQRKDQRQSTARPPIAGGKPSEDAGGVYLGDSELADSGVSLGLRSLLETDPCKPKEGLPRGDCGPTWTERFASNTYTITPTEQQLRRMYPGIIPPCPYRTGCEGGEWISANGTRSVFSSKPSPMMAGAGGLTTGAEGAVGHLLPNDPYHIDPGFGD